MRKFFIVFAALMFCIGCKREEVIPSDRMAVQIEATSDVQQPFAAPTRADSYTFFTENSQVGIYMVNYVGGNPDALKNTGNHADNECFTADANGVLRKLPPVFYPKPEVSALVDIYAYYPYTANMANDVSACLFEVKDDQSDTIKLLASDLCWAKNLRGQQSVGIAPSPRPVPMEFVHKFSKIRVSLSIAALSPSAKVVTGISNVRVNGAYRATTLNLASGAVTLKNSASDSRSSIVPFEVEAGVPGGAEYVYDVIVPAQAFWVGYNLVTFDLNFDDGSSDMISYKVSDKTFGASQATSLAGKLHKINLTLNSALEIILTGSQITDWTTGVTGGGVVDNTVTTLFKATLSDAAVTAVDRVVMVTDFEGSFDIKSGVTFAGGVCKFQFEKNKGPRDYGFRITSLQFFNGTTQVTGIITKTSARVYTMGEMDLGTW